MKNVLDVIKTRRTTRAFTNEQITDEEIMSILDAGNLAPSGHNMQPWHFTVVQDKALMNEMSEGSKEVGKTIPDEFLQQVSNNPKFNIFYNPETLIVLSYKEGTLTPIDDISAATQNMLLQIEHLGLAGCWNGFVSLLFTSDRREEFAKKLNLPEGHIPYNAISVGHAKAKVLNMPERRTSFYNFIK